MGREHRLRAMTPPGEQTRSYCRFGPRRQCGFSLIEILAVLAVLALLVAFMGLPLRHWLDGMRVRTGLNRIAAEIYRARVLGVESGDGAFLAIQSDGEGCAEVLMIGRASPVHEPFARAVLDLPGLCLRHSGDSLLLFNSRGMLKPPTRSFYASFGAESDSVLISIAGRVRRSY